MSYTIYNQLSISYDYKYKSKFELMQEALYIANLFYIMNRTLWSSKSDVFYIIPSSWFEKWKAYTNYDYYISKSARMIENIKENKCFFEATEEIIKNEIENHMENTYFNVLNQETKGNSYVSLNNKTNISYPGYINNSSLVYEGYLCHRIEDVNIKSIYNSYSNINIKENLCEGTHFLIVTKEIWDFFNMIYGGLPIMRYRIDISNKESIIEVKLKSINLVNLNIKKSKIEKAKFVFISRGKTVKELKKHLYKIFFYEKDKEKDKESEELFIKKHIRLWVLSEELSFSRFEEYLLSELDKNTNDYNGSIHFPGILLDQYENSLIGEIDQILNENSLVILEHKWAFQGYSNKSNSFIFKITETNYMNIDKRSFYQSNPSNETSLNEYFHINLNFPVGFYDSYTKYMNISSQRKNEYRHNSLFHISDYFMFKYRKDIYEMMNEKKEETNKVKIMTYIDVLYKKEVDYYRKNLYMIYEKSDIINKFEVFYSKVSKTHENNVSQIEKDDDLHGKDVEDTRILSRYDMIMKKRSKLKKEINQKEGKTEKESNENCKDSKKCLYCNKESEIDYKCDACKYSLYCSEVCKNKDMKFHKRRCKVDNN